jgi:hypothetical protein
MVRDAFAVVRTPRAGVAVAVAHVRLAHHFERGEREPVVVEQAA